MKKGFAVFMLFLIVGCLIVFSVSVAEAIEHRGDQVLISQKVKKAPVDASSPQWGEAKEAVFVQEGAGTVEGIWFKLKVKSVYTKDKIFFLLKWPDKDLTLNINRWKFTGGKWTKLKGDEDRLGMVWPITRVDQFASKGCTVFCHHDSKNKKEWYYSTNSSNEKADLWHWKSVRSNPVGYTEDGFVIDNPSREPGAGKKRDAGSKTKAKSNLTKDKLKPSHMQDPAKPASIKGSLLVTEAVEIKDYSIFKEGDEIPGYMLYPVWKDSFADVKAKGVWKDGTWTVMMSRKLKTGNVDDVQFNTRRKYPFGVAVFDNASRLNSHNSEPLKLQFK
ncbi:MAG: ethylbenzene dehydrogenase-related protein [Candidatus Desulfatibia sp.]|uniref:ethylbenzene dehydrogenase-related protein n=1 Tax=Candidatus Desulfatibia sp. TaxID=3101189 RepID=UPI002F2CDE29